MIINLKEGEQKVISHDNKNELLYDPKIRPPKVLGNAIASLSKMGKTRVGFTNGKFRILHPGHCVFLKLCKTQCDILVVAINSDLSLRTLKQEAPFSDRERAISLAALECVNYVTIFDEETPDVCIFDINPDVVFKGPDYKGKDVVSGNRDVIIFDIPFPTHSSDILVSNKKSYFNLS